MGESKVGGSGQAGFSFQLVFASLCVCLFVCLFVCLSVSLFVFLFVCLSVCYSDSERARLGGAGKQILHLYFCCLFLCLFHCNLTAVCVFRGSVSISESPDCVNVFWICGFLGREPAMGSRFLASSHCHISCRVCGLCICVFVYLCIFGFVGFGERAC